MQILLTKASTLRVGLPYAFLTPDLNFVPEPQRQAPGGIPSHLRVAKVYYLKDLEAIDVEFESAKSFGDGAAEEWRKGLFLKGKESMADAARWEKWEAQMHFGSDLSHVLREYDLSSFPNHREEINRRSTGSTVIQSAALSNGKHGFSIVSWASVATFRFPHSSLLSQHYQNMFLPRETNLVLPFEMRP